MPRLPHTIQHLFPQRTKPCRPGRTATRLPADAAPTQAQRTRHRAGHRSRPYGAVAAAKETDLVIGKNSKALPCAS